ncbi:MAG TPA: hypothetical protein VGD94_06725 [Vicinamibacterales bacterium]
MHERGVLIRAAISGAVWAGIAILLTMTAGGRFDSVERIAWGLRGGLAAAPVIGLTVGLFSRRFEAAGLPGRIVIALATLYGAAFLFLLAAGVAGFAAGEMPRASLSSVFFDSWNATIAGLTWTGFVVVLGPLAFLNHLWVSRASVASSGQDRPRVIRD